LSHWT